MYHFNKKQKIILGILTAIVAGFICYYVYAKEDNIQIENDEEIQKEETKEEIYKDDTIFIHISGAVNQEGVIELKANSRVSDAIEQAGGLKEEAFIEEINLAYQLEDGIKIHIPTKEEKEKEKETNPIITNEYKSDSSNEVKIDRQTTKDSKVNINTATQTQLETLAGIGPSTANKIISYRKEKGKFQKIEEIKEVNGIGEAKFEKIKDFICVK